MGFSDLFTHLVIAGIRASKHREALRPFCSYIKIEKKMQFSNFKATSTDERTAAAYCAEKSFHSVRNPLAADFSIHLHRLWLRN